VQRAGRFDPDHGPAVDTARRDQSRELLDTLTQDRQRHRLDHQTALTRRQPDAMRHLPRIDRDHQPVARHLSEQQL
jgi:hypothetical protein